MKNIEYEAAREKLIPAAESYANRVAGYSPRISETLFELWANRWNRAFHRMMERLVREQGLVRG